jgi:hypothetical protein
MNSLAYEKLPTPKNKPSTNIHIQMTIKNLRMVINNNYWYHSPIIYTRQLSFSMQGLQVDQKDYKQNQLK